MFAFKAVGSSGGAGVPVTSVYASRLSNEDGSKRAPVLGIPNALENRCLERSTRTALTTVKSFPSTT